MRNAEEILNVIRDRGRRGLPLEDVYRLLYKPSLYLQAYGRIYRNDGAMTRGVTQETVDGMSLEKIETLIEALRFERYRWKPTRRVEIPKAKQPGKTRPLGIPTWSDKLLQEVMRSILGAYYEPQFSDHSHGFRPARGCHMALTEISRTWRGTKWFIEGDIKGCFDNIDHQVLLSILREKLHDNRFLRLVEALLKAGYLERWDWRPTLSGTPQGGIISPLLANIYLNSLDQFVEQTLIPEYTRGEERKPNLQYKRLRQQAAWHRAAGRREQDRELAAAHYAKAREREKQFQTLPSRDPQDPNYRRLRYVRYADDFLLAFAGPKAEAEEIKEKLATFLRDELKLEMSAEKTLITHAATQAARFLGYEITVQHCDAAHDRRGQRTLNGGIGLRVPAQVVEERSKRYLKGGKPIQRNEFLEDDDFSIVAHYQAEYRGFVQYYLLAENVAWLNKLRWAMEGSLVKTLARKHKTSVSSIYRKYRNKRETEHGPRRCLQVTRERQGKPPLVAYFGGIPLRRKKTAILKDELMTPRYSTHQTVELVTRLLAEECEVCGSTEKVEVHHVRKLADLKAKGVKPLDWKWLMATRKRKTLVLCQSCHKDLHAGRLQREKQHAELGYWRAG
jgi:group II intron reverse transcriptase/maturase